LLALPTSSAEEQNSRRSDGCFGDDDGNVHAICAYVCGDRQKISQRNLHDPESEEMNVGWCDRVSRAVEGLEHHHPVRVADVSVAQDTQASGGQRHDHWIIGEEANDWRGKDQKDYADDPEKQHVVKAGAPHCSDPNSAR